MGERRKKNFIGCWVYDGQYREIKTVAQIEANKQPYKWRNYTGEPNISKTLQMLIWMGLDAYKRDPRYNQNRWDVAVYMVDHDGLRPEQVRRDEIDSILSAFDSIEKDE